MGEQVPIPAARPIIGQDERAAVDRVLRSGTLSQGPEVAAFESEFSAELVAGRECVAVNSGTSGLHLSLLAAGVGSGDEVIVPSFTFAATANAVALTGASPVFADIEAQTFTLDPGSVAERLTSRTKAILPVHLYGQPADLEPLAVLAQQVGAVLLEDAAQAHGAQYHGAPVGTFGACGTFSLYPTKNMTAGEGGMVACATGTLSQAVRRLRNQGMDHAYAHEVVGLNNRMSDLHAAIGRVQLARVHGWTAQRRANAAFFDRHLRGVVVPTVRPGHRHVYHQYTVRLAGALAAERDRVVRALEEEYGVAARVYYPTPCHELPALRRFAPEEELPRTARATAEVISLPVHPSLSDGDRDRVATALNRVVAGAG
ncbi:MAG TPA: DegT/DnrJ/EryC1/StrS family aminotransferase [Ornithinimicrobium sp.]|uniref:DegT/DnrJ/EryC1/StrS family aminotransferase n=1 Tax=Ornithinimicrobium sp. TaxID=1977084 RepID=UPI002B495FE5|nr:DegT/DnrJ/EryC1/StrS family aminotransferase [Ornithinimicrobium sp.]HKJ13063.1 DegT/DnrJ/EryC1/StrS family aminotransferase [Ornithinimicrobium sp.]